MVASSAFFTCVPAHVTTEKSGLVAAPFIYLLCENKLAVPHKSFTPESDCQPGNSIGVGHLIGRVGDIEVRSPFAGEMMGVLALEGERVMTSQPIAWLRTR